MVCFFGRCRKTRCRCVFTVCRNVDVSFFSFCSRSLADECSRCVKRKHRSNAIQHVLFLYFSLCISHSLSIHCTQTHLSHGICMRYAFYVPTTSRAATETTASKVFCFVWGSKHTSLFFSYAPNRYHSNCQLIFTDEPNALFSIIQTLRRIHIVISITQCTNIYIHIRFVNAPYYGGLLFYSFLCIDDSFFYYCKP